MFQTIKGLIKLAQLVGSGADLQHLTTQYQVKKQTPLHFVPYGLQINPPATVDIAALQFSIEGEEDAPIVIITDMNNRDSGLGTGEVALGVPTKKARVYMTNGDLIRIFNENATLHSYLKNAMTVIKNLVTGTWTVSGSSAVYNGAAADTITIQAALNNNDALLKD